MSRRLLVPSLVAAFCFSHVPAQAQSDQWRANYDPGPATRRSKFTVGLGLGMVTGGVSGYPNEVAKIGVPAFQGSTGWAFGWGGSLWVGAALRDWLVVGLGGNYEAVWGGSGSSSGAAAILHLEGYPLFYRGGVYRDLALFGEFGAGGRTVSRSSRTVADGGGLAIVCLGVLYEPLRVAGHFAGGPYVEYSYQSSISLTANLVTIGFRTAFYTGP
jgi:hypothetical protein